MDKVCSNEYKLHLKFSDKISSCIHMRVVLKAWKMQDWRCHGKQLKIWHRWSPCRPLLEAVKIKTDEKEKSVGYYRCKDHGTFIKEDWKSTVYTNERVCLLQGQGWRTGVDYAFWHSADPITMLDMGWCFPVEFWFSFSHNNCFLYSDSFILE